MEVRSTAYLARDEFSSVTVPRPQQGRGIADHGGKRQTLRRREWQ
jgi:hypothetical protein